MEPEDCEIHSPNASDDEGFSEVPSRGKPSSGTSRSTKVTFAPNTPHQAPVSGPSASAAAFRQNIKVPPTPVELPQTTSSILNLESSNILPSDFLTANMILTIKLPPKQPSDPKRIIIIETNNTLFNAVIATLKIMAPNSIVTFAWSLGLLIGIGPPPPTEGIEELTQYIYQVLFRWPPSADITELQVQDIITASSAAQPHSTIIPTRSRRSDQPPSTFTDTPLLCSLIFSKNITAAIPISLKIKSLALTYQFTVALNDNCSDKRIREVLIFIMSTITNQQASFNDTEKFFQRVTPIHKDHTSAPRISNNWRHLATFQRSPSTNCQQRFHRLMVLHKNHRSKLLLPTSDLSARLKNASFSFFNEMKQSKAKTNTNLIDWMVSDFNAFTTHNPLSLGTETDSESSSATSEKLRNPANPWAPLANLIPPGMLPPFQNYNESLHQYQADKRAHLNQPKISYTPSSTPLSPIHSTSLSISFTTTVENIVYTVEGPLLFTRYDFGQFTTFKDKQVGNTCLLLCLAAATKLNPADLASYFISRTTMLTDANRLYDKDKSLRDNWEIFCHPSPPPNFVHLASNFPLTKIADWAGSFTLGATLAFNHISTLAPSEVCNCSILFITDDPSDDNHDICIDAADAPNRIAYFPPRELHDTPPIPVIILHRHNHYTLLSPLKPQHDAINQILTFLGDSAACRHHPYIPLQYSHAVPNIAHLVGLSSSCIDIDALHVAHQLLHKDISDNLDRSLPPSQSTLPTNSDDIFTPSPALGNKHHRRIDNPGSSETAQQALRPRDSQSPVIIISSMSLSSSSPPSERGHTPVHRYPPTSFHPSDFGANGGDIQPSPDDPSSPENLTPPPFQLNSSASSTTDPPPWLIERIIRCAPVAVDERPRPSSPTNARNFTYLVHRKHLANIWVPYSTIRNTTACDHFIISCPEITGHTYLNSPPPSINSQTDTNSVTSSTNLGDLVFPQNSESRFRLQVGVRGNASSDTSSLSGSYDQSAIGSPSTSAQPSITSTGSFHPHATDTSHPTWRLPQCTNPICASMVFGCFHQDNHSCDICFRLITVFEYGYHCPHCDRDYCITCHPIHWVPTSSLPSTQVESSCPTTQEILSVEIDPSPPPSHLAHHAPSPHTVAPHSRVESED